MWTAFVDILRLHVISLCLFCIFVTHFYVYVNPVAAGGIMFLTCLLACICQIFTDQKFTGRLSNKPFLILLLTTRPHLKYFSTLPCNLSLFSCFLTLMFYKVVWQHKCKVLAC